MSVEFARQKSGIRTAFPLLLAALFVSGCGDAAEFMQPEPAEAAREDIQFDFTPSVTDPTFLFAFNNGPGNIEEVDIPSGVPTIVGNSGFSGASGLATSRAPFVVGTTSYPAGTHVGMINARSVIVVDTENGTGTLIATTTRSIGGRGIAFGPDGKTLYLIESSGVGSGELSTIDFASGDVTPVATHGVPAASLEWDPDSGTFYALYNTRLYNIAPDGTVVGSVPLSGATRPTGTPCTLARWPDTGQWYTMNGGGLYELHLDGTAALVGSGGLGSRCGTAFAPKKAINEPPVDVTASGTLFGIEGDLFSFSGTGHDPLCEPVTFEWDFGDGNTAIGQTVTHIYGDDGPYDVTLTVKDPSGLGTVAHAATLVFNAPPMINGLDPASLEGEVDEDLTFLLSFSDPGADDTFTITVDWGDGSGVESLSVGSQDDVPFTHQYASGGTYQGSISVIDDDGAPSAPQGFTAVVSSDTTPPEITVDVEGDLGNEGWYTSNVDVTWTVSDPESDVTIVAGCVDTTFDYDTDGVTLVCEAESEGGTASADTTIKRDATAPTVTIDGNAGAYDVADYLDITCSVFDDGSGIADQECVDFSGPAYTFPLGTTTFTATAEDVAGNTTAEDGSFTVSVSSAGVCSLVERFVSHKGVANSLCAKLRAADRARNDKARRGPLGAFINEVEAQAGKKIDPADAAVLVAMAQALM